MNEPIENLTIYPARAIRTMEPGFPHGTAVAVSGSRIVDVGTMATLKPWMDHYPHEVDPIFQDKVLMPGFFDAHLHPFLAAVLLTFDLATPDDWDLPSGFVKAARTREAYFERLTELHAQWDKPNEVHIIWGWHPLWHGKVTRQDLDEVTSTDPLVVWHRSYHEVVANTAALEMMALTEEILAPFKHQIDLDRAHFYENGIAVVLQQLSERLQSDEKIAEGLSLFKRLTTQGGVTSVIDLNAGGNANPEREWAHAVEHLGAEDAAFRTYFIAAPMVWRAKFKEETFDRILAAQERSTDKLIWPKSVKSLLDGAFISQLFAVDFPGYIDGHHGEWLTPPEKAYDMVAPYWREGFDIYTHVNGDLGTELALDVYERLQNEHPRQDYRYNLEHMGVSREDQVRRMAGKGLSVSVNGYFHQIFANKYSQHGLGPSRAAEITRIGSIARNGIPFSLHSDCPMGPIKPLWAAASAVTRRTQDGVVLGEHQSVSVEQAMRAITIDAAWTHRLDRDLGSIAAGKIADFTVLEEDPFEIPPDNIKNIKVWGTVFEGRPSPAR